MKSLTFLASFLFAVAAQATPAVGDQAVYEGTWGGQAVWQRQSFTAFNAQSSEYTQLTEVKVGTNNPSHSEQQVALKDTASDAALQYLVAHCADQGGSAETVTVPAGTFPTCKLALQDGGNAWLGQVPFGVVKLESQIQNQPLIMGLTGMTRGQ